MKLTKHFSLIGLLFLILGCSQDPDPVISVDGPELSAVTSIQYDEFEGQKIVLIGNQSKNFIIAFNRVVNGEELTFETTPTPFTCLDEGSAW